MEIKKILNILPKKTVKNVMPESKDLKRIQEMSIKAAQDLEVEKSMGHTLSRIDEGIPSLQDQIRVLQEQLAAKEIIAKSKHIAKLNAAQANDTYLKDATIVQKAMDDRNAKVAAKEQKIFDVQSAQMLKAEQAEFAKKHARLEPKYADVIARSSEAEEIAKKKQEAYELIAELDRQSTILKTGAEATPKTIFHHSV